MLHNREFPTGLNYLAGIGMATRKRLRGCKAVMADSTNILDASCKRTCTAKAEENIQSQLRRRKSPRDVSVSSTAVEPEQQTCTVPVRKSLRGMSRHFQF